MAVLIMAVPATVSVYAAQGPFINIGPPFDANSLATFTAGGTIHVVYEAPAGGVYYGLVLSGPGGNSESLQDVPQKIIDVGTNPGLFVAAGKTFVVANNPGDNEPNFATCNSDDDDCEEARPVGTDAPSEVEITFASGVETYLDDGENVRDSRNTFDSCNEGCDSDAYVVDPHPAYDIIPGTQWISHSSDGEGQPNDVETYFAEFVLPEDFTNPSITIDIHADNIATIFLNGEQIGQQFNPVIEAGTEVNFQDPVDSFTATDNFQAGTNVLAFEVENFNDPSGLDYKATVTYETGGIIITSFPSFSTIQSLQSVVYNLFFGTPQIPYAQAATCDPATPPQVTASSDAQDVYFVWEDCGEIMFQASHDGGATFEDAMNLSNNVGKSRDPRIAMTGAGTIVVTWQDNTPGNEEIFYSRSTNGGEIFNGGSPGSPVNLSNTNQKSDDHQLKALDDDVYVTWVDYKTGNGDIYFRAAKDNDGASFGATKNLSTNVLSFMSSRDPDLAAHDAMVSVVWTVHLDKKALLPGEIIFRESLNEGSTFGKQIPISKTLLKASKTPQLDYTDDGERYVAWLDKGGPVRNFIATGTFAVLASESEDGKTFTKAVNQSDSPNNLKKLVDATLLEVVGDVTVFDPGSRRG